MPVFMLTSSDAYLLLEVLVGHPQLMDLRHRGKLGVRQGAEIVRQCLKPDIEQP